MAWNNVSHPITKLENGAEHAHCFSDLSFLGSVRCTDFNVSFIASNVVGIRMRVITEAMAANYVFYAYHRGAAHNLSLVQLRVYLKGNLRPFFLLDIIFNLFDRIDRLVD